jgi:phenylacetate-CoA ligase
MRDHFDPLETRSSAEREQALAATLPAQVLQAQKHSAALARILKGVDAVSITSRQALARLPVTRKSELLELQKASRPADPFGGFAAVVRGPRMPRIFASPGPIYEPDVAGTDYWRIGRAMYAAGFRSGELVHNAFSYHMTPGAFMMESGAHAVGCTVFPAGTGQTEQQLAAMADLQPNGYSGTPSFLRILLEKAQETGVDISCIRKALVTGEACPPSLRD